MSKVDRSEDWNSVYIPVATVLGGHRLAEKYRERLRGKRVGSALHLGKNDSIYFQNNIPGEQITLALWTSHICVLWLGSEDRFTVDPREKLLIPVTRGNN